jgi:hypothetical protein
MPRRPRQSCCSNGGDGGNNVPAQAQPLIDIIYIMRNRALGSPEREAQGLMRCAKEHQPQRSPPRRATFWLDGLQESLRPLSLKVIRTTIYFYKQSDTLITLSSY